MHQPDLEPKEFDITDTPCRSACCANPFGICATHYACRHHLRDLHKAKAKEMDRSRPRTEIREALTQKETTDGHG